MAKKILIAASLLAADLGKAEEEILSVHDEIDLVHFDVMDGHYVPNLEIGLSDVRETDTDLPKWVHLMIEHPERFVDSFIQAGADWITFHSEVTHEPTMLIEAIKEQNVRVGLALHPHQTVHEVEDLLSLVDHVMVMTVEPGKGGQKLMPEMLEKVSEIRQKFPDMDIAVDGGVNFDTIKTAASAGANVFVAGTAIFKAEDRKEACRKLREKATL